MVSIFGGVAHAPQVIFKNARVEGFPQMPDGYIITAGNWRRKLLEELWAEAPDARI
jgi:hypothetical protein